MKKELIETLDEMIDEAINIENLQGADADEYGEDLQMLWKVKKYVLSMA